MERASGLRLSSSGRKFTLLMLGLTVLLAIAPASQAAPLTGTTLTNPGDTIFASLIPSGTAAGSLLATMLSPYSFVTTAGTTSGTLRSAVFMNPSGTLDFYYQVDNSPNSATAIARETDTSFVNFLTYTGYRIDGGSLAGGFVNGTQTPVTADRNAAGTVVGFSFFPPDSGKVLPGTTSSVLVISTNATLYTAGNAAVIDGGTQTVAAFQPLSGVPEPTTMALMGAGLVALACVRKRRK